MQTANNTNASAFVGSIPENYDTHMGPMFFLPYAQDMAERVAKLNPSRVLETAAGTGIVTEQLRKQLPNSEIIATDLNPAMMERAKEIRPDASVAWQEADGTNLPFEDNSFDVVVTQFGLMFYPDKQKGLDEAFRVLKPGGTFLFNVWERVEKNDVSKATRDAVEQEFPEDTPGFLETPFGWFDSATWLAMLTKSGFQPDQPVNVRLDCRSESASSAASGLVLGSPLYSQVVERVGSPEVLRDKVAAMLAERFGDHPMSAKMEAIIFQAKKPG